MNLIAVTSGKGGTGKSCVAAYTGAALAKGGAKTLLIEQGRTARSLDIIIAAHNDAVFNLTDLLEEKCAFEDAVVSSSLFENLFLIPADEGIYEIADSAILIDILKNQCMEYDYVMVDGVDFSVLPPSLFDMILLVTTPDTLSVRACSGHARYLDASGAKNIRMVINHVPPQIIPIHNVQDFDDVIDIVGVQLIAVIPSSPKLQYGSNNSTLIDQQSITCDIFALLAGRIQGKHHPLLVK